MLGQCNIPLVYMQMRDGEAPSYYNPVEASTLVRLLQGLLSYNTGSGRGVTTQDIGVIATYRNQAGFVATAAWHCSAVHHPEFALLLCSRSRFLLKKKFRMRRALNGNFERQHQHQHRLLHLAWPRCCFLACVLYIVSQQLLSLQSQTGSACQCQRACCTCQSSI